MNHLIHKSFVIACKLRRGCSILKKFQRVSMPDAFVILFGILLLVWITSFFVPSGTFERMDGGKGLVIPNSFAFIENAYVGFLDLFLSIQEGFIVSANLIFLVIIMGGTIAVIESVGTTDAGVHALVNKTKGKKYLLVVIVSTTFGLISAIGVGSNAVIAFIPLGIILAKALKLDAIAGISIVYLGYFCGSAAAVFDPITLGVAQEIAGLPIFSGLWLRIVVFIGLISLTIVYTNMYIKKISNDPTKSLMGEQFYSDAVEKDREEVIGFNLTHKILIIFFILCIGIFVVGSLTMGWGINELAAVFIINAVGSAIIARITPNDFVRSFMKGAKGILYGALIIGIARSITILMENAQILDTFVHYLSIPLGEMGTVFGALAMFLFNLIFNLLVPSGSGQAAIVMPLLTPLADTLDLTRQTAVIAFKLGDGITNIITPTSGVLMAVLAIGGVSWSKWVKYALPLVGLWTLLGMFFVIIAVVIDYGPF